MHNQLSARVGSQINFSVVYGRMQDLPRGANYFCLGGGGWLATRGVAMRLLGGFEGMFPRKFVLEWCNLVPFGEYFHKVFTFKKSKNIIFYTKIIINCSHVLARGSRSMVHSPLIIFIKGCNL